MDERLRRLSDIDDQLEAFARVANCEISQSTHWTAMTSKLSGAFKAEKVDQ
ncbi:hypothetical protein [Amaricoccus solimangrovi]|uniref:hypothetical protein n=1 Tax=Amaricoccus solimangrovi TaxID=2589815 RepID=UPI0015E43048|nr:hypothetical protein [Amaricoccus solimangrovi]